LVRIYDISGYHFIPNRNPPFYKNTTTLVEFHDLSFQRRFLHNSAADMFTREALSQKFSKTEAGYLYGHITNSVYSPVMFLPQAAVANILWRRLDFPILPTVMLMRIAGLLLYIAGSALAIRALPFGKWVMMALALSPMAAFTAISTWSTGGRTTATIVGSSNCTRKAGYTDCCTRGNSLVSSR